MWTCAIMCVCKLVNSSSRTALNLLQVLSHQLCLFHSIFTHCIDDAGSNSAVQSHCIPPDYYLRYRLHIETKYKLLTMKNIVIKQSFNKKCRLTTLFFIYLFQLYTSQLEMEFGEVLNRIEYDDHLNHIPYQSVCLNWTQRVCTWKISTGFTKI